MLLDTNTRQLQLKLGAPRATSELSIVAEYTDTIRQAVAPVTYFSHSAGTTPVDIVPAPDISTARQVVELHVHNDDSVQQQVVIFFAGTSRRKVQNVLLNPGDVLHYNPLTGWTIIVTTNPRGPIMKNYRLVQRDDAATIDDDHIGVDCTGAAGGKRTITFNPAIVTDKDYTKTIIFFIVPQDTSGGSVDITDGTNIFTTLVPSDPVLRKQTIHATFDGTNHFLY